MDQKLSKRVLIITYYWPPSAGSGVQRWLKFAKYLPDSGWEPVIFTPENPDFDLKDEFLLKEIPESLEVMKFPIWEPYSLLDKLRGKGKTHPARIMEQKKKGILEKAAIWLRANFLVPDPRVFWVKPSVKFLSELVKGGQFEAIITTGPPHSMHLIGRELKRKTGVKWVADFRDPWSEWEFLDTMPMSPNIRKKHQKLEESVLKEADEVLTISPTFQKDLERLSKRKVRLLTNGFDPADLPKGFQPKQKKEGELHLVYTGIIDAIRNPLPLFKALKEEFSTTEDKVKFTFVGKVSEQVKKFVEADTWLKSIVDFAGYVSHQKVFEFYAQADALVLILTDTKNAKGNIPGKLFDYLAIGVPVLALGDPKGDSAAILQNTGMSQVVSHEDHVQIQIALRKLMDDNMQSESEGMPNQYSRKYLSAQLAEILDENTLS